MITDIHAALLDIADGDEVAEQIKRSWLEWVDSLPEIDADYDLSQNGPLHPDIENALSVAKKKKSSENDHAGCGHSHF
jgi:hypothetical protein